MRPFIVCRTYGKPRLRNAGVSQFLSEQNEPTEGRDTSGRRVEIMLNDELYDRVRIKAMRQRKSLRALGAELFEAWANDEEASGRR